MWARAPTLPAVGGKGGDTKPLAHRVQTPLQVQESEDNTRIVANPSFVPAREPGYTPRMLLLSTLGFSALLGSLNVSECVVVGRWYIGAPVGRAQAPSLHEMSAATGRRYTAFQPC